MRPWKATAIALAIALLATPLALAQLGIPGNPRASGIPLHSHHDIATGGPIRFVDLDFGTSVTLGVPLTVGAATSNPPLELRTSAGGSDYPFLRLTDLGGSGDAVSIYGPVGGPTNARALRLPDQSGTFALTSDLGSTAVSGSAINRTGQTADANGALTTAVGQYSATYYLEDTAADLTAGIVTLTLSWTDDAGATTATATQTLTATGRTSGTVVAYVASGSLSYATTHTGAFSAAQYALRIRVEALQ